MDKKKTINKKNGKRTNHYGEYSYEKVLESYGIRDTSAIDYDRDDRR